MISIWYAFSKSLFDSFVEYYSIEGFDSLSTKIQNEAFDEFMIGLTGGFIDE
jgi:hypothetical protein